MNKLHSWLICFDVAMPQEMFTVFHKTVLGCTQYGLDVLEGPNSVTLNCFKPVKVGGALQRIFGWWKFREKTCLVIQSCKSR